MSIKLFLWDDGQSSHIQSHLHNFGISSCAKPNCLDFVEIDNALAPMWDDFQAAQEYRHDTTTYLKYCLGLTPGVAFDVPTNKTIALFKLIADPLCKAYADGITPSQGCSYAYAS